MGLQLGKTPGSQAGVEETSTSFFSILRMVRKHWPIILASVLVAAGVSLVYSKSLARVYQAQAMLELDPSVQRPLGDKSDAVMQLGSGEFFDSHEYYETQYKIITSTKVLVAVARNTGLPNDFDFFGLKSAPAKTPTPEDAALALRGRVSVEPVRNSRLLLIKVDDTNPKRAARLCDAIASAFIDQNLEKAISSTSESVAWLGGQVDNVKKDLEINENALHSFKEKNDLPSTSINEASNMLRQEMQDLNSALTRTRMRKQELLARHGELSKVTPDSADVLPASELLSSGYLQALRKDYVDAVRLRKTLIAEGKGDSHPTVKAADQKMIENKSALIAEVRNIQGAVERDLAVVEREEAGEAGLYETAHKRAVDLNMKEIEYHRIDRSRDQNEKLYAMLLEHMKDADLARMMRVNNIRLIEAAAIPSAPIRPRTSVNVTGGIGVGLLIGLLLMWLRDTLDSSLKTPEDVEKVLGVTFLGLLPQIEENEELRRGKRRRRVAPQGGEDGPPELIVHDRPHSGIAEAARSIRTNLMFTNPDHPYKKLLVTSAAPSEGKTTVACSIAIALAQSGQRVCIIDCDLRRPRLHKIFGTAGQSGVTNVLVGDAEIEEVARPTVVENLWCISSGPTPPNPADLLHSERFKKFLDRAAGMFDRIVIDSPPLVAVTDSAIISTLVDGTVIVLRAFQTTRALGRQGMRTLSDVDAPVIGAVLNAVDLSKHEYSHYQQYYYYKREAYGSTAIAAVEEPRTNESRDASPPAN